MKVTYLSPDQIQVPDYVERASDRVEDDLLRKSVERGGIQQPFVVVPHNGQNLLADGLTRLRIARVSSLPKVPCVFDPVPEGETVERHIRRVRFIVNFHRQDLLPSQEAELIQYFKNPPFEMTHREISKHLGIAPDSVTNALAIKNYIEPVAKAVDSGQMTRQAARCFDGLSEKGQRAIWKEHRKEIMSTPGGKLHAQLRKRYSPDKYSEYYRQPELIAQRLNRKAQKRKATKRPAVNAQDKLRLMSSLEWEQAALTTFQAESERLYRRMKASIVPVNAIFRSEKLLGMIPENQREQLEYWKSAYC